MNIYAAKSRRLRKIERDATITIQKIVRGRLARVLCKTIRYNIAVTHIQSLWRGITGRARSDRMWLDRTVTVIQKTARKFLCILHVNSRRKEFNSAVHKIQGCYRIWAACRMIGQRLLDRETQYREDTLALLTADEEFGEDRLMKQADRMMRKGMMDKLHDMSKEQLSLFQTIQMQENLLTETRRQLSALTPRAIQQGWKLELTKTAHDLREKMTIAKHDAIFLHADRLRRWEEDIGNRVEDLERMARHSVQMQHCRDMEAEDNRARAAVKHFKEDARVRRQIIGDEKRKWAVRYYTANGKPDRRRRPGRPWAKEVVAGLEKATYCGGHDVDLNAFNKSKDEKGGPGKAVDHALNQLSLETYLEQVHHYEGILQPLMDIMKKGMGEAVDEGDVSPERRGWGAQGAELVAAVEDVQEFAGERHVRMRAGSPQRRKERKWKKENCELVRATSTKSTGTVSARSGGTGALKALLEQDGAARARIAELRAQGTASMQDSIADSESIGSLQNSVASYMFTDRLRRDDQMKAVVTRKSEEELQYYERRKQRKRDRRRDPVSIPWTLLDSLGGETERFDREKHYIEFQMKY